MFIELICFLKGYVEAGEDHVNIKITNGINQGKVPRSEYILDELQSMSLTENQESSDL